MKHIIPVILSFVLAACGTPPEAVPAGTSDLPAVGQFRGELSDYWYKGTAELSRYDLEQIRYGELHPGEAVLIQVTEDFLTEAQVKNDNYTNPASTPVIKTNLLRRFTTGIYDYSTMTSVFTPTDLANFPLTLKVTTSVQDWCGQVFTQLNYLEGNDYRSRTYSYFENEGDQDERIAADLLEDELFNRIRTGTDLPTGEFRVLPATTYLRMAHVDQEAVAATLGLAAGSEDFPGEGRMTYSITYPSLPRTVNITFDAAAPHVIRGWTETYNSRGQLLTGRATLKEQSNAPYWQLNAVKDSTSRAELGL